MTLTRLVLIIFFSNLCSTSYADINSSHAISMHGIPKSSKSAKEILKSFGEEGFGDSNEILVTKSPNNQVEDDVQPTLDRFG